MISLMVNTGNVLKFCDFVFCNYQYESMCPAKASNFNVRHFKTFCMLIKECNKINRKEDFQVKSTSVFYIFEKHHICPVADPELFVKRGGGGGWKGGSHASGTPGSAYDVCWLWWYVHLLNLSMSNLTGIMKWIFCILLKKIFFVLFTVDETFESKI